MCIRDSNNAFLILLIISTCFVLNFCLLLFSSLTFEHREHYDIIITKDLITIVETGNRVKIFLSLKITIVKKSKEYLRRKVLQQYPRKLLHLSKNKQWLT